MVPPALTLKAQFYGRSSEKCAADEVSPDQRMLFNEAEVLAAISAANEADVTPILIEAHARRQQPGRKVIPAEFPRIPVVHDIAECDKHCPHDGTALTVIGKETAERYDLVRPQSEKAPSTDHYMIVRAAGPPGRRIVCKHFSIPVN